MQIVHGFDDGGFPMTTIATAIVAVGELNIEDDREIYCELGGGQIMYIGSFPTQMMLQVAVKDYVRDLSTRTGIRFLDISSGNGGLRYIAVDHVVAVKVGDEDHGYYIDLLATNGVEYALTEGLSEAEAIDTYNKLIEELWGEKIDTPKAKTKTITLDDPSWHMTTISAK